MRDIRSPSRLPHIFSPLPSRSLQRNGFVIGHMTMILPFIFETDECTSRSAKVQKLFCCLQIIWLKSDDLTFHFRSLSFISFYLHLSSFIYKLSKVSGELQKCEGDVRENECPSRASSPLYIGLRAVSCEYVRDIFEFLDFFACVYRFGMTITKASTESGKLIT